MQDVLILGASGMLGSMLVDALAREGCFKLSATVRSQPDLDFLRRNYPSVAVHLLDAETCSESEICNAIGPSTWVINAIGLIKQRIIDGDDAIIERAVRINTLFSFRLARVARECGARVIQVATDCVYSGKGHAYDESAPHDCSDVYGRTKSLGEVCGGAVCNLRCSIVGFERKSSLSLLNWFLSQPRDATVNGFTDHLWNGVTTLHFAKICHGIITRRLAVPSLQHVVPDGAVTKDELLRHFSEAFGRQDIRINPVRSSTSIDRTLATKNPDMNGAIWQAAGYQRPPTIRDMIFELARYRDAAERDPGMSHGMKRKASL
jgi:dTDP-4-dehydrorhamnose reductase